MLKELLHRSRILGLLACCFMAGRSDAVGVIALDKLDVAHGYPLVGIANDDRMGYAVSAVGDFNGDGKSDFLVSAEHASAGGFYRGSTYVVFGRSDNFPAGFDVSMLDGTNGLRIDGSNDVDGQQIAASSAGDVNGDGFADVLIGAPANGFHPGFACVVFGRPNSPAVVQLGTLNGLNGFCMLGEVDYDNAGHSVVALGDFNGDGVDDIAIGAFLANFPVNEAGSVYVVFGRRTPFPSVFSLSTLDGTDGFRIDGENGGDEIPSNLASGDINGDGLRDLIIGAESRPGGGNIRGSVYVVFGSSAPFTSPISVSSLDGSSGFRLDGAIDYGWLGRGVGAGDVNGDGIDDLLPGAFFAGVGGSGYVYYGKRAVFPAQASLTALNGSNGYELFGATYLDRAGEAMADVGDINGDGIDDVAVGAAYADYGGQSSAGSIYVAFGSRTAPAVHVPLASLSARTGFRMDGADAQGYCGLHIAGTGDINGDGIDDMVVGCHYSNGTRGAAYVIYGNAAPYVSAPQEVGAADIEDPTQPLASTIAEIAENRYLDAQPLAGAALTSTPLATGGHWEYRLDSAAPFVPIPNGLSVLNALILGPAGQVRFVAAADYFGDSSALAIRFWDGAGSYQAGAGRDVSQDVGAFGGFAGDANVLQYVVPILPVNDAPTFSASDPPLAENSAGVIEIASWATISSMGPPNEASQSPLGFIVGPPSDPSLFSNPPSVELVGNTGTLRYEPAPDARGTTTFTVRLRDNGGTLNGGIDTSAPLTVTISIGPPDQMFRDGFE